MMISLNLVVTSEHAMKLTDIPVSHPLKIFVIIYGILKSGMSSIDLNTVGPCT